MTKRAGLRARQTTVQSALDAAGMVDAEKGERIAIGARVDVSIHDALREIAFRDRVSINSLIIEGLEYVIDKRRP